MKIKKGYIKRKIDDAYLVVATIEADRSDLMIELNETSSDIWDFIDKGYSIEEIVGKISELYGITNQKANKAVQMVIKNMKNNGILEED